MHEIYRCYCITKNNNSNNEDVTKLDKYVEGLGLLVRSFTVSFIKESITTVNFNAQLIQQAKSTMTTYIGEQFYKLKAEDQLGVC